MFGQYILIGFVVTIKTLRLSYFGDFIVMTFQLRMRNHAEKIKITTMTLESNILDSMISKMHQNSSNLFVANKQQWQCNFHQIDTLNIHFLFYLTSSSTIFFI